MGMFDDLRCDMKLPNDCGVRNFQTKDTPDQYLEKYVIRANGTLMRQNFTQHTKDGAPPNPLDFDKPLTEFLEWRRKWTYFEEGDPTEYPDFHGDLCFYDLNSRNGEWWEFVARFTEGKCVKITLIDMPAELEGDG